MPSRGTPPSPAGTDPFPAQDAPNGTASRLPGAGVNDILHLFDDLPRRLVSDVENLPALVELGIAVDGEPVGFYQYVGITPSWMTLQCDIR